MVSISARTSLIQASQLVEFALMEYRNGFRENDYASAALVGAELTYVRYQDGVEELTDLSTDPEEQRQPRQRAARTLC